MSVHHYFEFESQSENKTIESFLAYLETSERNQLELCRWELTGGKLTVQMERIDRKAENAEPLRLIMEWIDVNSGPPRKGPTLACIKRYLPKDRPFTKEDLAKALEACSG